MHELLTQLQVVSTLQVPMMLNGVPCGVLVIDDCRGEHEWTAAQIGILKLLADFIGTVLTRERAREALRYREEILAAVNASEGRNRGARRSHVRAGDSAEANGSNHPKFLDAGEQS